MRFALIGPPQSGKSTLFSAITGQPVAPSLAVTDQLATVHVPDERLDFLAEIYKPKKYTTANLEFLDVPGASLAATMRRRGPRWRCSSRGIPA